jgi:DNA polymerase III delta prime subunit
LGVFSSLFFFWGWGDMGPFVVPGLLVVVVAGSAFKLIARKGTGEKLEESKPEAQVSQSKPKHKSQSESKHKSDSKFESNHKLKSSKDADEEDWECKLKSKAVDEEDWEWPIFDEWFSYETRSTQRKRRIAQVDEDLNPENPFEVVYVKQEEDWPAEMSVTLFSTHLVDILSKCLARARALHLVEQNEGKFCAPHKKDLREFQRLADETNPRISGNQLFLAMNTIRNYKVEEESESAAAAVVAAAKLHFRHFLRFLEKEFKDTQKQYARMKQEGTTSWLMLWAFLPPGEKVCYHCQISGELCYGIVHGCDYNRDQRVLKVVLQVMDYNGQSYRDCTVSSRIPEFEDERSFNSLNVCPMSFVQQRKQMEDAFLANGKRFFELSVKQNNCFMRFEGPLLRYETETGFMQLIKHKADGRVMIDLWSFVKMNPGYQMGNASPPNSRYHKSGLQTNNYNCKLPDDESLRLAPAIVYGFSFSLKKWGCFPIIGFSEISFDDHAFDRHLVMSNEVQKKMMLGLVSQHLHDPSQPKDERNNNVANVIPAIDPISNKGEGCIFLCYGPPGTGKTLTAESVAEKLHRPLWSISAPELTLKVEKMEENFTKILDIASSWRAVLLLDEADVYLEKRTSTGNPKRNAMTGVFLRLLEYYKGVLFLTTNLVTTFDDAFCSRISMFVRYHRLTRFDRAKVWETLLSRVGLMDINLDMFAAHELNGREIRNSIRIAHTWATNCNESLTTKHILEVVKMLEEFRSDLQDAVLDESQNDHLFSSALATLQQQHRPTLLSSENATSNGAMSSKP